MGSLNFKARDICGEMNTVWIWLGGVVIFGLLSIYRIYIRYQRYKRREEEENNQDSATQYPAYLTNHSGTAGFVQPGTGGFAQPGIGGFDQPGTGGFPQHGSAQPGNGGFGQPGAGTGEFASSITTGFPQPSAGFDPPSYNEAVGYGFDQSKYGGGFDSSKYASDNNYDPISR